MHAIAWELGHNPEELQNRIIQGIVSIITSALSWVWCQFVKQSSSYNVIRDRPIIIIFYLCYAAMLIKLTYYGQKYAQE